MGLIGIIISLTGSLLLVKSGLPEYLLYVTGLSFILLVLIVFRRKIFPRLSNIINPSDSSLESQLGSVRELLAEYSDVTELGKVILKEIQRIVSIENTQLTLYYDQPLAMEVTHILIKDTEIHTSITTMRQDDDSLITEDEDFLSPDSVELNLPLTFRDRLIGLIIVGKRNNGIALNDEEIKTLEDLLPLLAAAIDNVTMIRNLSDTNQRLFESEKLASIGQLAGGIAHEIRNPLSSMKMNIQGLSKLENLTDRNRRRIQICLDEIERLNNIVGELMHLSRRTRLEVAPTSAKIIIDQCVHLARAELKERKIDIRISEEENLPEIKADEARLTHAMLNLVLNAAQAIGQNGKIEISAEPFGRGIELNVQDNGPGIPDEIKRDLFNPFFTTKAEGLGLGLANVLKSVQEHGGELDFVSRDGKGAVFSIRLPEKPPDNMYDPSALRVLPT